ncbi:hypothetical protein BH09PSE3_BH09PSE3_16840 [soil metagenome]
MSAPSRFIHEPDPAHPGWMTWDLSGESRFNSVLGKMIVQRDGDIARARIFPEFGHTNLDSNVHGGVMLTLSDIALFVGAQLLGRVGSNGGVTLDLSMQFIGAGKVGEPMDAEVELLRETGRMVFLRGIILQEHGKVAAFSGTLRKATVR